MSRYEELNSTCGELAQGLAVLRLRNRLQGTGTQKSNRVETYAAPPVVPKKRRKKTPEDHLSQIKAVYLAPQMSSYQIAGGNAGPLVDSYLAGLGWKKIVDKQNFNWKLKWIEVNSQVNYGAYKDGDQLVNRIPNCSLLTNKLGLYNSLSEYNRVLGALKGGMGGEKMKLKMDDFVPETYRIDQLKDRTTFLENYKDGEIWICKPCGLNQGKGIFLIRSLEQVEKMLEEREQKKQTRRTKPLMPLIVQRYIERPMLLDGKKFDIRAYMIIPSTMPFLVLYHSGYVRVTCEDYDLDSLDLTTHLTNQFVQKKHEDYKDQKEDTVWSMAKMNEYVNNYLADIKNLDPDWLRNTVEKQMKSIMKYCFNAVKHKLQARMGFFDIYGLDFMLDADLKLWLIEINVNPAMHTNCEALKETMPPIVEETLDLALECFEKTKKNQPLFPLTSLKTCQVLFNGCTKSNSSSQSLLNPQPAEPGSSNSSPQKTVASNLVSQLRNRSPNRQSQNPIRRSSSPSKENWGYISRSPIRTSRSGTNKDTATPNTADSQEKKNLPSNALSTPANNRSGVNFIKSNMNIQPRQPRQPVQYAGGKQTIFSRHFTNQSSSNNSPNSNQSTNGTNSQPNQQEMPHPQENISAPETKEAKLSTMEPSVTEIGGVDALPSMSAYDDLLPDSAPLPPSQISARARTPTVSAPAPWAGEKTPEQIMSQLKEYRVGLRTPVLPPLYTLSGGNKADSTYSYRVSLMFSGFGNIQRASEPVRVRSDVAPTARSDVVTSRVLPAATDPQISLQGYPAIPTATLVGGEHFHSPVQLRMVHMAYGPPKIKGRTSYQRRSPMDRAS